MKIFSLLLMLCLMAFSCKKDISDKKEEFSNQEIVKQPSDVIPTLNYKQLKPLLNKKDNKTYVVNFWATWCIPCIKELPYFEKVNEKYKSENVEVILVSLDFPKNKEDRLIPFVKTKNIQSRVLHLDDPNEQFWIADISEDWSGAIPATIIYNKDRRKFYEQSFTQEELENEIQTFLN